MKHLGKLQEDVTAVVGQEHERSTPASQMSTFKFGSTMILKVFIIYLFVFARYLVRLQVQENDRRAIVVTWWINISTKSFRLTSKN